MTAFLLVSATALPAGQTQRADSRHAEAKQILVTAGVRGGLVVHLGCGDGRLTAALRAADSYVVHGLARNAKSLREAREHIRAQGLCGRVSVGAFDGYRLPYVDNLVNLLVADDLGKVPMDEVMRVLAPRGVAIIDGRKTVKPWPDAIDEWSHYLHGPDNNALANDRVVGPPRHMQWLAGPQWTRHHHADKGTNPTIRAVVSSRGRLYYIVDETASSNMQVPSKWFLTARDAFSGVLLWRKPLQVERYERRLEQVWRTLVADGERVYAPLGIDQLLSELDGATGAVLRNYEGTERLQEFVKSGATLFVVGEQGRILALLAETGKRLWQWEPRAEGAIVPLTLAACQGKVFVKTDKSVCCLSADEGTVLWQRALEGPQKNIRLRWPRERLLVNDDVVLCSYGGQDPNVLDRDRFQYLGSHPRVHEYGGKLAALSAEDGRVLWTTDYLPGLESTPGEIYISEGVVWLGPAFDAPRDLHTGALKQTRPVLDRLWTTGHHYRCYPGKATVKYILTAKRGIEMIDLIGENHSRNNWVRATCRGGVTPCNGLLYAPPHSCGCYMEAKLSGFWALAAESRAGAGELEAEDRLQRGPAYGKTDFASSRVQRSDWCTYRGNPARSGSATSAVPLDLKRRWEIDLGGRLSPVTVAEGKAFVAQVDAHTVHALDADDGKQLWHFTAGGRVDSPPTIDGGLVLFGSRDGCVYCLRASDGGLVWRFQATPRRINAVAYEQVESLWPVHGSVLIVDGIAYVVAGRSSYLDDGIVLYGLHPETGEVQCSTRVVSEHTGALDPPSQEEQRRMETKISQNNTDYKTFLAPDRSDAFSMRGALTDVLVAEDDSIFMRHMRFDGRLVRQDEKLPHLFSTSSLLDGAEHHRSYWVLGTADFSRTPVSYPWIVRKSLAVPYGLMLAFDARSVWGVHRVGGKRQKSGYALFAAPRPDLSQEESLLPDFATRSSKSVAKDMWTVELPLRPRAIVHAHDALIVGGTDDKTHAANAPYDREMTGILRVVSDKNGRTLAELRLEAAPVWDGLATAGKRLYLAATNGHVICLSGGE